MSVLGYVNLAQTLLSLSGSLGPGATATDTTLNNKTVFSEGLARWFPAGVSYLTGAATANKAQGQELGRATGKVWKYNAPWASGGLYAEVQLSQYLGEYFGFVYGPGDVVWIDADDLLLKQAGSATSKGNNLLPIAGLLLFLYATQK